MEALDERTDGEQQHQQQPLRYIQTPLFSPQESNHCWPARTTRSTRTKPIAIHASLTLIPTKQQQHQPGGFSIRADPVCEHQHQDVSSSRSLLQVGPQKLHAHFSRRSSHTVEETFVAPLRSVATMGIPSTGHFHDRSTLAEASFSHNILTEQPSNVHCC